jgi:hypothetical protein
MQAARRHTGLAALFMSLRSKPFEAAWPGSFDSAALRSGFRLAAQTPPNRLKLGVQVGLAGLFMSLRSKPPKLHGRGPSTPLRFAQDFRWRLRGRQIASSSAHTGLAA